MDLSENSLSINITFSIIRDKRVKILHGLLYYTSQSQATQSLIVDEKAVIEANELNIFYSLTVPITENDHGLGAIFAADAIINENSSKAYRIFGPEKYLNFHKTFAGMKLYLVLSFIGSDFFSHLISKGSTLQ